METESLALEAFQRHPDFRLHRTVSVLVDVLFIKHLFIPCGIEPHSSQAVEIQTRIVAEFHRDYRRTTHREGQVPAPVATSLPPSSQRSSLRDGRDDAAGTGKSDRPEAYLIRMLQYEAMHLPFNTSTPAMESDPRPEGTRAGSLSDLLDSALGLLDTEE